MSQTKLTILLVILIREILNDQGLKLYDPSNPIYKTIGWDTINLTIRIFMCIYILS